MPAGAPQRDLATKDFVAAELSKCATKDDLDALETKLEHKMDAGFEHAAKERAEDRAVADKRHKRMRAAAVLVAVEIAAAEAGWLGWLERSFADSGTDVSVFDIVHDMGAALGAEWSIAPPAAEGPSAPGAKQATTLLTRQSQHIRDAAHTAAA